MSRLSKPYSGVVEIDQSDNTVNVAYHDGSAAGLKLNGVLVTAPATDLNKMTGVSSTAAEIDQRAMNFQVTLGTADDQHIVIPWACNVTAIYSVIDSALTVADETLTFKDNGGTGLTGGVITVTQSGSADGDIDSVTPSANNAFTAGQKLTVSIGGENGTAAICNITVLCDIT